MASLSIVIPTLGRSTTLSTVIGALSQQQPPLHDAEVRVSVDATGPDPNTIGIDAAGGGLALAVDRAGSPGASAARNAGWRSSEAPLILFLDDDVVPGRELVAQHLAWHQREPTPEVGVLGRVRWSRQIEVTPFMSWLEHGVLFDYDSIEGEEAGWGRFYSCNVSLKRSMLERVDGFDEREFPFLYEDLDLARRMSEHGFRLLYNRAAEGEHLKTETLETWRKRLPVLAGAERRFVSRYPDVHPYFYERFRAAANATPARGRAARLAPYVSPKLPWLGPLVWHSYDARCWQQLAPEFLAEWETAQP